MNDDDVIRELRAHHEAAPEITVAPESVVAAARRRRLVTRSLTVGSAVGAVALVVALAVTQPWSVAPPPAEDPTQAPIVSPSPAPGLADFWTDELDTALAMAETDEERATLADGVISPSEYEAAVQTLVDCVNERLPEAYRGRFRADERSDGTYEFSGPSGASDENGDPIDAEAWMLCSDNANGRIVGLYGAMLDHPPDGPFPLDDRLVACLVVGGAVPDTYTRENLWADGLGLEGPFPGAGPLPEPSGITLDSSVHLRCLQEAAAGS